MRYRETGNLHMTFHDSTNFAVAYLMENYGEGALRTVIENTAGNVYRSINQKMKEGDISELVAHWVYFFQREKCPYRLSVTNDEVILEISECPAFRQMRQMNSAISPHFCKTTTMMNEYWCEGSPFQTFTECHGDGACKQIFRRRSNGSV